MAHFCSKLQGITQSGLEPFWVNRGSAGITQEGSGPKFADLNRQLGVAHFCLDRMCATPEGQENPHGLDAPNPEC